MKTLKVFETFAGIGSQHKALEFLKKNYKYKYEIVAISEWDIDANISYASIHYPRFNNKLEHTQRERERERERERAFLFIKIFTFKEW